MAIAPTGAIYKSLIFDGEDSRDYGVYITGEAVYNAPGRDVEMVEIPGRNGSFALDKGRFENIEVSYPAGIFADNETDFAKAVSDFRNYLCSRKGYCRLVDEYNPEEYRMAIYKGGLEVSPAQLKAGEFTIVFDCKPQRWLTSGEEAVTIGEYVEVAGTDNEPYLFRASPQFSDEYDTEIDKIVGGTVAWNQLCNYASPTIMDANHVSYNSATNEYTITYAEGETTSADVLKFEIPNYNTAHKYLTMFKADTTSLLSMRFYFVGANAYYNSASAIDSANSAGGVILSGGSISKVAVAKPSSATTAQSVKVRFACFDLTAMFGSTIADYIYSLETANAGAGVAWFRKLFPKPYYAYNAGELMSVQAVSHDMVGFNQWDEEWELGALSATGGNATSSTEIRSKNYIPVVGGQTYYLYCAVASTFNYKFYDADKNFISGAYISRNNTLTIPNDARYMRFYMGAAYGTTYKNDICINLAWDNSRNGEYEPYELHSYPLDSDLTLRGIPKLDANNGLYYDGDTYESDGTVTRKYGVVDLGSLNWSKATNTYKTYFVTSAEVSDMKKSTGNTIIQPIFCANYLSETWSHALDNASYDKVICAGYGGRSSVAIADSSLANLDATAFKTAMNGVYLVYELATPTTETADPYTSPQIVDDFGTEEYVSTSIVPVGHDTQYGENPNVLVNPTLFESSPLLEVEGYGNIEFNGYEIELGSNEIGEILIADATSGQTTVTFDTSRLLSGDDINAAASAPYLVGAYVTISGAEGYYVDAPYQKTTTNFIYGSVSRSSGYFDYGVPETPWDHGAGVSSHMIYNGNGEYINKQAFFNFRFILAYDGADTLNISYELRDQVNMEYITVDSVTFLTAPIYGESSKTIERAYIDCELGEAYCIDGGSIISLNQRVDLGSDLPKLASGANEITYDNTITSLKVHPRWWKV